MANVLSDTRVGVMQQAFYSFSTSSGSPYYIHLKTNIPASSGIMFYIEAEGYNYGTALPILCAWTGYTYAGTGTLIATSLTNFYSGMSADGSYQSSDSYVVLRCYAGSHYFNGFVLNSVMANPTGNASRVAILASSQNSTSGNYY
jgi:hypothetical protein